MSADLFAEFSEPSKSPPPTVSQPSPFGQPPIQHQAWSSGGGQDPFGFASSNDTNISGSSQIVPQWSSLTLQPGGSTAWGGSTSSPAAQASTTGVVEDDDDWGDFETSEPKPASSTAQSLANQSPHWASSQQPIQRQLPSPAAQEPPRLGIVRASTMDLMTNSLVSSAPSEVPGPSMQADWPSSPVRPRLKQTPSDPNVLFDAGDFELEGGGDELEDDGDEDDFGDFETVAPALSQSTQPSHPATKPIPPALDLLDLTLNDSTLSEASAQSKSPALQAPASGLLSFGAIAGSYPTAPKSPSYQQRNPFPKLAVETPIATEFDKDTLRSASPVTAWPSFEPTDGKSPGNYRDDDEWGAWDDMPAGTSKAAVDIDSTKAPETWNWESADSAKTITTNISNAEPPPVNVPPPSVILSIFPDLLSSANGLFKSMAGQSASIKDRILSDPKAVEFLKGYILLVATAGHVIAGRKHRWHRDKILAKSMSISAAGSKGMKLAGVDKTQAAREDREAADIVAVWRDHVGRVRSAVATAKTTGKANLRVPELGETMPIQTAKMAPTAPKPCVICGLKREERVSKVDYEVEDSFGEWWVEHWGHRACKNFWVEHEQKLRQR